ncbi:MAG TPA: hypothetical protein VGA88_10610, partial [Burkholderiales bacterium]
MPHFEALANHSANCVIGFVLTATAQTTFKILKTDFHRKGAKDAKDAKKDSSFSRKQPLRSLRLCGESKIE